MAAIITFIPSLVLPSLFQIVLSGSQVVLLPIIEVITSVIYMALTTLGCGGCGLGGGTIGAVGGGTIMAWIVGAIMSLMSLAFGVFGFSVGDLIQMLPPALGMLMDLVSSVVALITGLS